MKDLATWLGIAVIVLAATAGNVFISRAMKTIGDLGLVRRAQGLGTAISQVLKSGTMWTGIAFMALGFFALLFALSWAEVSLVAPASASLTFITNAVAARIFLREDVDRRRWIAAILVAGGVAMLSF
jgi:drug/metabolite transporter (DMT)-like permease